MPLRAQLGTAQYMAKGLKVLVFAKVTVQYLISVASTGRAGSIFIIFLLVCFSHRIFRHAAFSSSASTNIKMDGMAWCEDFTEVSGWRAKIGNRL